MIIMNKSTKKVIFDAKETDDSYMGYLYTTTGTRMQSEIKKSMAIELKEVAKC